MATHAWASQLRLCSAQEGTEGHLHGSGCQAPEAPTFMSCFQWRGRMAGWCSSDTSGSDVCIAFSASSSFLRGAGLLSNMMKGEPCPETNACLHGAQGYRAPAWPLNFGGSLSRDPATASP